MALGFGFGFPFLTGGGAVVTDPYWPFVSMLLHGDGTNAAQNNTFLDGSTNNFTVTRVGNTTQGSFNPFVATYPYDVAVNGGSGYFDGTADYLRIPSTSALIFPASGSFTVESWVYLKATGVDQSIISSGIGNGLVDWYLAVNSTNRVQFVAPSTSGPTGYSATGTTTLVANTWYHIAATRVGGTVKLFLNGTQETITQFQSGNSANQFGIAGQAYIGTYFNTSSWFTGYISNLRVVNGTALYTASFTPSTVPLTAVTNTALLLGFTNGAIYDNAELNNLETVSTAQISTSIFKYGTGSVKFNGTTDYLITPAKTALYFAAGDFTIEGWIYKSANGSADYDGFYQLGSNASVLDGCSFEISSTRGYVFFVPGIGIMLQYNVSPNDSTWHHVAVSRTGNNTRLFVDGTQQAIYTSAYTIPSTATVATIGTSVVGTYPFNGYIDDFRLTKGVGRYTANFTPPTAAFPNSGGVQLVDYAVVAGGGGGGAGGTFGGGGGAGGYKTGSAMPLIVGTTYTITVGAGGAIATNGSTSTLAGSTTVSTSGGGRGGDGSGSYVPPIGQDGTAGGSGGGGGDNLYQAVTFSPAGGAGTSGQGFAGGLGSSNTGIGYGGGGGGAGGVGSNGNVTYQGGPGVVYAGTGSTYSTGGDGRWTSTGAANTGNGGGGASGGVGAGGSGVVIFRTTDSTAAATSTTGSPTITVAGGYRVYTFTASGTITF